MLIHSLEIVLDTITSSELIEHLLFLIVQTWRDFNLAQTSTKRNIRRVTMFFWKFITKRRVLPSVRTSFEFCGSNIVVQLLLCASECRTIFLMHIAGKKK